MTLLSYSFQSTSYHWKKIFPSSRFAQLAGKKNGYYGWYYGTVYTVPRQGNHQWLTGSDNELIKLVETSRTLCPVHFAHSTPTFYKPVAREK